VFPVVNRVLISFICSATCKCQTKKHPSASSAVVTFFSYFHKTVTCLSTKKLLSHRSLRLHSTPALSQAADNYPFVKKKAKPNHLQAENSDTGACNSETLIDTGGRSYAVKRSLTRLGDVTL